MIKDLNYIKNGLNDSLRYLEGEYGIKYRNTQFKPSKSQIISLTNNIYEITTISKTYKNCDVKEIDNKYILEKLSECLIKIAYLANILDADLTINTAYKSNEDVEDIILSLNKNLLQLKGKDKLFQRNRCKYIFNEFINLVNKLGFKVEDLKVGQGEIEMRKDEYVKFRATREEVECLKDLAETYQKNVSDFLRMLILEKLEEEGYI